jgi:hypothetical protein
MNAEVREFNNQKLEKVRGNEDDGIGWGMDFDEDEIKAF